MSSTRAFEMKFGKQRTSLEKPVELEQSLHEYKWQLHHYTRLKF